MLWHLTAGFLYVEMFLVFLLLTPLFSTRRWAKFFKIGWIVKATAFSSFYFNFFLVMLGLVCLEAVRQVMHQRNSYEALKAHPSELRPETESLYLMRMFRSQRNLYIAGFALYMFFVFRRCIRLINEHAQLSASQEASLRQAKSASATAEQLLMASHSDDSTLVQALRSELENLKDKLANEEEAHQSLKRDWTILKKQATQASQEYDRVSTECQELQNRLTILSGSEVDKKSD